MVELATNDFLTYLGSGVGALTALGLGLREYLKRDRVGTAVDDNSIKGFKGNETVLDNLIKEVDRLTTRLEELEAKVGHLTDKLANVRLLALDCYGLASECECNHENREALLMHLKMIIKDS